MQFLSFDWFRGNAVSAHTLWQSGSQIWCTYLFRNLFHIFFDARSAELSITISSNKPKWNNCFIKNTQRNTSNSATIIGKKTAHTEHIAGLWYMSSYAIACQPIKI